MTKAERKQVGSLQTLSGLAKGLYLNDRAEERAGPLIAALDEMFKICVSLLSRYPPEDM